MYPYPLLKNKFDVMGGASLSHVIKNITQEREGEEWENFVDSSLQLLKNLGYVTMEEDGLCCLEEERPLLVLLWELRHCEPSAFTFLLMMRHLEDEFARSSSHRGDSEISQIEFFSYYLLIFDRYELLEGEDAMLSVYLRKRSDLERKIEEWKVKLEEIQEQIKEESGGLDHFILPCQPISSTQLDGVVFDSINSNEVPPPLPPIRKHQILRRLVHICITLAATHNCIYSYPNRFGRLIVILRKSFLRVRYIIRETIERDLYFEDVSCSGRMVVEDDEEGDSTLVNQWDGMVDDDEEGGEEEDLGLIDMKELEKYGLLDISRILPQDMELVQKTKK